jgi:hypothetical protein
LQPAPWRENNRRPFDHSDALAQFDDVLTQAADLEEAPAWWVRPLDQLRADESDGGAAAKERSDNGESVHSSSACGRTDASASICGPWWGILRGKLSRARNPGTAWGKAPCSGPCAECPYDPDSPGSSVYRARHRELVAGAVPQHVGMNLEGQPCLLASPFDHPVERGRREGRTAFGIEQLTTVSNDIDTKVLQVLGCDSRQDRLVYLVLAESRLIPFEAQAPQPIPDIHGGVLFRR